MSAQLFSLKQQHQEVSEQKQTLQQEKQTLQQQNQTLQQQNAALQSDKASLEQQLRQQQADREDEVSCLLAKHHVFYHIVAVLGHGYHHK